MISAAASVPTSNAGGVVPQWLACAEALIELADRSQPRHVDELLAD